LFRTYYQEEPHTCGPILTIVSHVYDKCISLQPWYFSFAPNATEVAPIAPGIIVSHVIPNSGSACFMKWFRTNRCESNYNSRL